MLYWSCHVLLAWFCWPQKAESILKRQSFMPHLLASNPVSHGAYAVEPSHDDLMGAVFVLPDSHWRAPQRFCYVIIRGSACSVDPIQGRQHNQGGRGFLFFGWQSTSASFPLLAVSYLWHGSNTTIYYGRLVSQAFLDLGPQVSSAMDWRTQRLGSRSTLYILILSAAMACKRETDGSSYLSTLMVDAFDHEPIPFSR